MSLALLYSRAQLGVQAPLVTVEVHLSNGLPGLAIVGLPETTVKESKDRVRSALQNANFEFPARRITVNLAPADLPKEGGRYDLPIALGILAASGQVSQRDLEAYEFVGELTLAGAIRPVRGALSAAIQAHHQGRTLVVPTDNQDEAGLLSNATVLHAAHLLEVCAHLNQNHALQRCVTTIRGEPDTALDLADIEGQPHAKRALAIAAAGAHSLLMIGPPGTGKTMLASRLNQILPPMTEEEALECASIASISPQGVSGQWRRRPFRAPHHSASAIALVGGGSQPRPGEVSLAHNGVLFLDELAEFDRRVLEMLREPLEAGRITISRARHQAEFPARFQLIAAMNPCPCGYLGDAGGRCHCTGEQVQRYRGRISGPLLDRIDMHVEVPAIAGSVANPQVRMDDHYRSERVRHWVRETRCTQLARDGKPAAYLTPPEIGRSCRLAPEGTQMIEQAMRHLGLSMRSYHRILKVARTIADLAGKEIIELAHLREAISYRCLERQASPHIA